MAIVTVVGAGFSGLVSAYYLTRAGHQVTIVEKSSRIGGLIQTEKTKYGLTESAANAIVNSLLVEELCAEVGVELIGVSAAAKNRYIYRNSAMRRWPLRFVETIVFVFRLIVSLLFRKMRPKKFESISNWAKRTIGEPVLKYLLGPALQGVYAGNVEKMSASLILAPFFNRKKRGKPELRGSVAPVNGMGELFVALEKYLQSRGVKFVFESEFNLEKSDGEVVLCVNAMQASQLLKFVDLELSNKLSKIEMLNMVRVSCFYDIKESLPGFGCLFRKEDGFRALGVLQNHNIFIGRGEFANETWIFGGALDKDFYQLSDEEVLKIIEKDRFQLTGKLLSPISYQVHRWPQAIPHYDMQVEEFVESYNWQEHKVLLMGNYLGGLGLAKILEKASELPNRVDWHNKRVQ